MEYGLIGGVLGHSYSKMIHEQLANYTYTLCPLPTQEDFTAFMEKRDFKGINVTIPYKRDVIPYCAALSPRAAAIGAVNTLVNGTDGLFGDNTDYAGFLYMVHRAGYALKGKRVLVLGTGGTSHTVCAALADEGAADVRVVSRRESENTLTYAEAAACKTADVIINTTPCGMFPHTEETPLSLANLPNLSAVFDVIYNPAKTQLLAEAEQRELVFSNGLPMLVAQAKFAAELFTGTQIDDARTEEVLAAVAKAVAAQ